MTAPRVSLSQHAVEMRAPVRRKADGLRSSDGHRIAPRPVRATRRRFVVLMAPRALYALAGAAGLLSPPATLHRGTKRDNPTHHRSYGKLLVAQIPVMAEFLSENKAGCFCSILLPNSLARAGTENNERTTKGADCYRFSGPCWTELNWAAWSRANFECGAFHRSATSPVPRARGICGGGRCEIHATRGSQAI